jgi:hypothetical protein
MNYKSFVAALLIAGAASSAQAADFYYSNSAGSDANPCTFASPCQTLSAIQTRFNTTPAGNRIFLARGDSWSGSFTLRNPNSDWTSTIILDAYTPTGCVGSCATSRPIITIGTSADGIAMDSGSPGVGYKINNIEIDGNGSSDRGVFLYGGVRDVVFENVKISGFRIGIYCEYQGGVRGVAFRNGIVQDNHEQGFLWGCGDSYIENNIIDNNGFTPNGGEGSPHYHNVYINANLTGQLQNNITVRGNTLTRNSILTNNCRSVSLVAHGKISGLVIEDNYLYETTSAMNQACYGIAVDTGYTEAEGGNEEFQAAVIRRNITVNMGHTPIGCNSCPEALIESNVIIQQQPTGTGLMSNFFGIVVPDATRGSTDIADTGAIIRNNSLYIEWAPGSSTAINVGEYPTYGAGTNLQITNNLIYFGTGVHANHACFNHTNISNFTSFNNNLCYHANGNGVFSSSYATQALAAAAGYNVGGSDANPNIAAVPTAGNEWSIRVNVGSPVINGAHSTYKARTTRDGCYPQTDIGAYKYGCSP